jgi:hydroxymethylglutaryl-CoA reductase
MTPEKLDFITKESIPLFKKLSPDTKGKWGKMNGQQMVEHVAMVFDGSTGKIKFELVTPAEHLPKYLEFLYSDKEFRENTKAPANLVGDEPLLLQYATMEEAVEKLSESVSGFESYFKNDPDKKTMHLVFGELNFEEWALFHFKHVTHHLRQFGLI